MLRRVFMIACFASLALVAGVPAQALAHGGHAQLANVATMAADDAASAAVEGEAGFLSQSLQSYSQPGNQPLADKDCHCPACGCSHASALSDAPAQFAPLSLRSHAASRGKNWSVRRWRSAIENPPKTFA